MRSTKIRPKPTIQQSGGCTYMQLLWRHTVRTPTKTLPKAALFFSPGLVSSGNHCSNIVSVSPSTRACTCEITINNPCLSFISPTYNPMLPQNESRVRFTTCETMWDIQSHQDGHFPKKLTCNELMGSTWNIDESMQFKQQKWNENVFVCCSGHRAAESAHYVDAVVIKTCLNSICHPARGHPNLKLIILVRTIMCPARGQESQWIVFCQKRALVWNVGRGRLWHSFDLWNTRDKIL